MTAKKLPIEWPVFNLRKFSTFEKAYISIRDVLREVANLRQRITEATNDHADFLTATQAAGVPSSTPTDVGLLYLNTTAKDMYMSVGTASSADWKKITP